MDNYMTPELDKIEDRAKLARAALYQVGALARGCGASRWQLNHFFLTRTGLHAHVTT
jgi:hypothetical protein